MDRLTGGVVSFLIVPSFLVTAVVAFFNVAVQSMREQEDVVNEQELVLATDTKDKLTKKSVALLSEPPPSKTIVRQVMAPDIAEKLSPRDQPPLDRDIAFISGESEMPLSVYESPLMHSYRKFRAMQKNSNADGYYVVHKRRITQNTQQKPTKTNTVDVQGSIDKFITDDEDIYGDYNDNEVVLLYGRGPVFEMHDEYSDRFEGFDD